MDFFRDQQFIDSLENPAALDRRISSLKNDRLWMGFTALICAVFFFVVFFLELKAFGINGGKSFVGTPLTLFGVIVPAIRAAVSHAEIRILLSVRRLLESPAKPTA